MQHLTTALFLMLSTSAAYSGEVVLGLGLDDVLEHTNTSAPAIVAEYHASPSLKDAKPLILMQSRHRSTTIGTSSSAQAYLPNGN